MHVCRGLISLSQGPKPLLFSSSADYLLRRHRFSPETVSKLSSLEKYLQNPENSDSILSFLEESGGLSRTQLERVIKCDTLVLSANLDRTIKLKIKVLHVLGLSTTDISEIVSSQPWILRGCACNRLSQSFFGIEECFGFGLGVLKVLKGFGVGAAFGK